MLINYCIKYYSVADKDDSGFLLNEDNFEYYLLLYIDDELSGTEKAAFEKFVDSNELYKAALLQLQSIKLSEETIAIDKSTLHKNTIISADNVEEYYLRSIDNELTSEETNLLNLFLEEHPRFKEAFSTLDNTILPTEQYSFNQSLLLKVNDSMFDSALNWSALLSLYIDNELTNEQRFFVEQNTQQHPALQKELDLLKSVQFSNEKITFPHKKLLYKHQQTTRRLIPFWVRYTAAACLLAFIVYQFTTGNKNNLQPNADPVVKTNTPTDTKANQQNQTSQIKDVVLPLSKTNDTSLSNEYKSFNNVISYSKTTVKEKKTFANTNVKNELNGKTIVTNESLPRNTNSNDVVAANDNSQEDAIVTLNNVSNSSLNDLNKTDSKLANISSLPYATDISLANTSNAYTNANEVTIFDIDAQKIDKKGRTKKVGNKLNQFFDRNLKRFSDKSITIGGYEIALSK
jgi:hypothetical protein